MFCTIAAHRDYCMNSPGRSPDLWCVAIDQLLIYRCLFHSLPTKLNDETLSQWLNETHQSPLRGQC